jgi:NAD(P)H-flavin reductase
MLRTIAENGLGHRVTLVYSNRDRESTAFFEELQALDREHDNIRVVFTMNEDPSWEGETRTVDADLLRDHLNADLDGYVYLVAGPPGMVEGISEMLKESGIPENQILPDRFSGY